MPHYSSTHDKLKFSFNVSISVQISSCLEALYKHWVAGTTPAVSTSNLVVES